MDEGFKLYFEETDWLLRAAGRGVRCEWVPGALAVHEVGRSTQLEGEAPRWFEESAGRFRRKRFGALFATFLERLAAASQPSARAAELPLASWRNGGLVLSRVSGSDRASLEEPSWLELSPDRRGFPAAGELLTAVPELWFPPPRFVEALNACGWWLRRTDPKGRERQAWRVERP
jgi:hypothetical protein